MDSRMVVFAAYDQLTLPLPGGRYVSTLLQKSSPLSSTRCYVKRGRHTQKPTSSESEAAEWVARVIKDPMVEIDPVMVHQHITTERSSPEPVEGETQQSSTLWQGDIVPSSVPAPRNNSTTLAAGVAVIAAAVVAVVGIIRSQGRKGVRNLSLLPLSSEQSKAFPNSSFDLEQTAVSEEDFEEDERSPEGFFAAATSSDYSERADATTVSGGMSAYAEVVPEFEETEGSTLRAWDDMQVISDGQSIPRNYWVVAKAAPPAGEVWETRAYIGGRPPASVNLPPTLAKNLGGYAGISSDFRQTPEVANSVWKPVPAYRVNVSNPEPEGLWSQAGSFADMEHRAQEAFRPVSFEYFSPGGIRPQDQTPKQLLGAVDTKVKDRRESLNQSLEAAMPVIVIGGGAGGFVAGVDGALEMVGLIVTVSFISHELLWAKKRQQLWDGISDISDHESLVQFLKSRNIV